MRNIVSAYVERFLHDRRERLKFGGIVLLLAVIVVGIVFWRLSYVGVAMTNEVYCGQEEHQHDSSCYAEVLTCGMEESAGSAGHTHDSSCYETVTQLVCGLEESEGHIHDDSCFDEDGNLICALTESEGHVHDDSCYETTQVLICGLEEEPATEGHTHDSSCYELVLTCDIPEHTHSIECMMDETADVESYKDWEATLPDEDDLTGVWSEDLVLIAQSQIGYTESTANFQLAEDGETRQGYTRYGAWYGNEYGDWDAMFAAFCLNYAGVSEEEFPFFPYNSGAYAWTVELEEEDLYVDAEDHEPAPGDLIFLNTDDDNKADTVAVVTEVNGKTDKLTLIQGDSNDAVEEYKIDLEDETIVGFGILPDQPEDIEEILPAEQIPDGDGGSEELEEEEIDEAEASEEIIDLAEEAEDEEVVGYTAEDGGVMVTVSAPVGALPEDAELSVVMYEEESEEYAQAAEAIGLDDIAVLSAPAEDGEDETEVGMIALDICFTADGEEVEPVEPVTVTIDASALVPEDAGEITVTHLAETEDGVEPEVVATVSADKPVAEFEVESFSAFTVTWTMATGGAAGTTYRLSVTAYLDGVELEGISGLTFNSENDELDFETLLSDVGYGTGDYTFSYAIAEAGGQTYGSQENPVVAIEIDQGTGGPTASSNFLIVYADGSTGTVSTSSTVSVSAYYLTPDFSVSIEAVDEDESTEAWALQAVLSHAGSYESISYEWTVTDSDGSASQYAKVTNTDNTGRAYVAWEEGAPDNTEVTISVTVTLTLENGSTKTATADYVLEYGDETVDLIMTYGPNKDPLPEGVKVTLTSGSGEQVYTGTTSSDGWVHDLDIEPGVYTVTATYTDSDGNTYQCSEEVAFHDAGNYSINLNYYSAAILTSVPERSNWEHINIKVTVGSGTGADASSTSVEITGCRIIGSDGAVKYTATEDSIEGNDNEFQLTFYEGEDTTGTPSHSISFDTNDTITITYVLAVNGIEQSPVTISITASTVYDEGTTYPATGQRAYKIYNYLYGTSYSSNAQLIAGGISEVDISGMSMMLVATILCDSSEVTGAGQVQAVEGQSANQWGMDFALSIEGMNELAASWGFDVQKTYEDHSMTAGDFEFYLCRAAVNNGTWTLGSLEQTITNKTVSNITSGGAGNSVDTMKAFSIAYGDAAIQNSETYYYILYEEPGTITTGGDEVITYDGSIYGVMVQLGTDADGEAAVTATYYTLKANGDAGEGGNVTYTVDQTYTTGTSVDGKISFVGSYATFKFTNTYLTEPNLLDLDIYKYTGEAIWTSTTADTGNPNATDTYYLRYNEGTEENPDYYYAVGTGAGTLDDPFVVTAWTTDQDAEGVISVSVAANAGETYYFTGLMGSDKVVFEFTGSTAEVDGTEIALLGGTGSQALTGAEFTLTKTETETDGETSESVEVTYTAYFIPGTDNVTGETTYSFIGWYKDSEVVGEENAVGILATDSTGYIHIVDLPAETYTLTEAEAPDGYNQLVDSVSFSVSLNEDGGVQVSGLDENTSVTWTYVNGSLVLAVENVTSVELPHTGGVGTWAFTVAGLALITGAAFLILNKKRREKE